jgi:energy-coupling factor transport system ATP-binding protein
VIHDGHLLLDGTPKQVFSQVELLHRIGLEAPQTGELAYALRQDGVALADGCLDIEECADEIERLLRNKANGNIKA